MAKKKNYKRSRRPTRYQNYAAGASQLWSDVKKLKNLINVEEKHVDYISGSTPGYNGSLTTLNSIPQGDTDGTRDGDSLKMQKLKLKMNVSNTRLACARIMVIFDPQNKCTNVDDILTQVGTIYAPISQKNYDKRFNCKVLYDKRITIGPYNQNKCFEKHLRIMKHTQYEAGGTVINSGALKLLLIGDAVANFTTFRIYSRLTFTDN